jgi:hypothetical protein
VAFHAQVQVFALLARAVLAGAATSLTTNGVGRYAS